MNSNIDSYNNTLETQFIQREPGKQPSQPENNT